MLNLQDQLMTKTPQCLEQLLLLGKWNSRGSNYGLTMKDETIHPAPIADKTDTRSITVLKV
jgi:hypothetical protein